MTTSGVPRCARTISAVCLAREKSDEQARRRPHTSDHHIRVPADEYTGLRQVSFAMTEQVRAISDQRAGRHLGSVSTETLTAVSRYLHLFIV